MIIFWLIVVLVILILLLDRGIEKMYHYKKHTHRDTPAKYEIDFDEVQIPSTDGGSLYGWWIPSAPSAPTLILTHGWSRNVQRMMPYIQALHPKGYNLLVFDARNHGSSTPTPHPTVGTFTEDILCAVNYLQASEEFASSQIGLIGLSIGGGASIASAGHDESILSVITVGAMAHPIMVMSRQFDAHNIPKFIGSFLFFYMRVRYGIDFNEIAPITLIPNAKADILLIHGENDETICLQQAEDLLAARPDKTELWIVPEKGHSDCHSHEAFWERVEKFLEKTLPVDK